MTSCFKYLLIILLQLLYIWQTSAQNCNFSITVPQDITICQESDVILNGMISGTYSEFHWEGTNGLYEEGTLTPTETVNSTTTYTLFASESATTNLIQNGDFSAGNSGFTSDYNFVPGNLNGLCQGCYNINTMTPSLWNNCGPLDGDMMVINGAPILNQQVWCQTVSVNPNSTYIFSTWLQTIILPVPQLSFTIDGVQIGSVFSGSSSICMWEEFFTTWQSGSNTSVEICITNQNSVQQGNDFGLDNIFFGEMCTDHASFTVTYAGFELDQAILDKIDCKNPTVTTLIEPNPNLGSYQFTWQNPSGNIAPPTSNPVYTFNQGGTYTVTVTNASGCSNTLNAEIESDFEGPEIEISGNLDLDCTIKSTILEAKSNETNNLTWTYPNGSTYVGQNITATSPGQYLVSGIGDNGCVGYDTVQVSFLNRPYNYDADSSGIITCNSPDASIFLHIQSQYDSITWTGPNIISSNLVKDTITVGQSGTYIYQLHIGQDCYITDSIKIEAVSPLFDYTIPSFQPITCTDSTTTLHINPLFEINKIEWIHNQQTISDQDSITISEGGTYYFHIFDINGCEKFDSIMITENKVIPTFVVQTDTIDCISNLGGFTTVSSGLNSFLWSGEGQTSSDPNPIFTSSGEYQLEVTGPNGCKVSETYFLPSSVDYPVISTVVSPVTCLNPIGTIDISCNLNNAIISWTDQAGNFGASNMINSNIQNSYTITADYNGCTSQKIVNIPVDTLSPSLEIWLNDTLTCITKKLMPTVVASNYNTFLWTASNGMSFNQLEPEFTEDGNYTLTLTSQNGCTASQLVSVIKNIEKPIFSVEAEDITCKKTQVPLIINSAQNNLYTLKYNNISQPVSNGTLLTQPGQYTITATNSLGCDSTITFEIDAFTDLPKVILNDVILNCNKPTTKLFNAYANTENVQYSWKINNSLVAEDTLLVKNSGVYILLAIDQYGCQGSDTVTIIEDFVKPNFVIIGDTIIGCNETATELEASFSLDGTYYWASDSIAPVQDTKILISKPGTYTFYLKSNINGCFEEKTISINKVTGPESLLLNSSEPLCFDDTGSIMIESVNGGLAPYFITLDNELIQIGNILSIGPGQHFVTVVDKNNCELKDTIQIESPLDFIVDAGMDATINKNEQYVLNGSTNLDTMNIASINWSPDNTLSCDDCLRPTANPTNETQYTLTITDKNGCIHSDVVTIRVKSSKGFLAPNIFSPSNTGLNTKFTIYPLYESIEMIEDFRIYDRWGNLVFSAKNIQPGNPEIGWDGFFQNKHVVPGVYIWVANILYKDGVNSIESGDVTVVK